MSADNNHFMNREIQALQQEEPRQDAKAELVLALLKERRESKMSILRKATLPTLVSVAAIAGVFYVAQPKVMAATPDRVIKAIQDIKNYTIKSYVINGADKHLQSKTTVSGKDRHTVFYDNDGKETTINPSNNVFMIQNSPMQMGFKIDTGGDLKDMSKEDIEKMKSTFKVKLDGMDHMVLDGAGGKANQVIRVEMQKDADGKEVKKYFVNGKPVDKLPDGIVMPNGVIRNDGKDKNSVQFKVTKDGSGTETKHIFVNGKEVDKLPDGMKLSLDGVDHMIKVEISKDKNGKDVKHFFVNGKEVENLPINMPDIKVSNIPTKAGQGNGIVIMKDGKEITGSHMTSVSKSMAMIGKDGNPMIVTSGQTSADYLVNLLKDTSRWTIERGVSVNGQMLDKFTLKGPISPIVLFVDPSSALPKILRFDTPLQEGATIEDVYEYGNQP